MCIILSVQSVSIICCNSTDSTKECCLKINRLCGWCFTHGRLSFLAPPSAPRDVTVGLVIQSSFTLLWSEPDITNTDGLLDYTIEYGPAGSFTLNVTFQADTIQCDCSGGQCECRTTISSSVNPDTTYSVRVYAGNEFGTGPPSKTINVTTLPINGKLIFSPFPPLHLCMYLYLLQVDLVLCW